jgi:hypothetical protein
MLGRTTVIGSRERQRLTTLGLELRVVGVAKAGDVEVVLKTSRSLAT